MRAYQGCLLAVVALLGCAAPTEPAQPLSGAWVLDSSTAGLPPRQLTLTQRGTSVTGTGSAMGVDVPIPITVTGTYAPPVGGGPAAVTLHLAIDDGGGVTADFTGTLSASGRLEGQVTYAGDAFSPGSLSFVRASTTGLEGTITRAPVMPVCLVGVPCDAPFSGGFEVLRSQRPVARFVSDSAGRYLVLLAPGDYTIVPDSMSPLLLGVQSRAATVGTVGMTRLDLQFDTGIR
jgi:hypothetical protein